jgi:hypothetical protein
LNIPKPSDCNTVYEAGIGLGKNLGTGVTISKNGHVNGIGLHVGPSAPVIPNVPVYFSAPLEVILPVIKEMNGK